MGCVPAATDDDLWFEAGNRAFWCELTAVLKDVGYLQLPADPCLYFSWTMTGLVIWLTWIDDCLIAGDGKGVKMAKEHIKGRFDCDDAGLLNEYVGCKIDWDDKSIRFSNWCCCRALKMSSNARPVK